MRTKLVTALAAITLILVSCEQELDTIGSGVIAVDPFSTGSATFDVFASNNGVDAVQTNRIQLYQLGNFNDPIYGRRNASFVSQLRFDLNTATLLPEDDPIFGLLTQEVEDAAETDGNNLTVPENEQVTAVFLYLPFQLPPNPNRDLDNDGVEDIFDDEPTDATNDTDGDGVPNNEEAANGTDPQNDDTDGDGILDGEDEDTEPNEFANRFDLDSIFGDRTLTPRIRVERSNFFLADLDPENFIEMEEFFSDQDFSSFVEPQELFEGEVSISDEEFLFFETIEDDPETPLVNEFDSIVESRLPPGIRVPLDIAFFQENIIDMEGSTALISQANLNDFIRGIRISMVSDDDLMFLFDLGQANITIEYEFSSVNINGTTGDLTDDTIDRVPDEVVFDLIQNQGGVISGNAVNTFIDDPLPAFVEEELDIEQNVNRIFLKGGSGVQGAIRLFGEEGEDQAVIEEIRENNWIINEANLVFNIDRTTIDQLDPQGNLIEPPRLYLFNADTGAPLFNLLNEPSQSNLPLESVLNHDGILQMEDDVGQRYRIRITEHLNDIIVRDATNVPLALSVTSNILIPFLAESSDGLEVPFMSTINPLGTILWGSGAGAPEDQRLQLEIFFTQTEQ